MPKQLSYLFNCFIICLRSSIFSSVINITGIQKCLSLFENFSPIRWTVLHDKTALSLCFYYRQCLITFRKNSRFNLELWTAYFDIETKLSFLMKDLKNFTTRTNLKTIYKKNDSFVNFCQTLVNWEIYHSHFLLTKMVQIGRLCISLS